MSNQPRGTEQKIEIHLRQPAVAAFWAWIWPGAGHFYQRRYAKGALFMVCILTTYFFGLALGGGHVVYASWTETDKRWQYICQVGVGLPALPAIVQNYRVMNGKAPLFADIMAPPELEVKPNSADRLAEWHLVYNAAFELGTLYTMIAGLLNILAIYDAFSGPVIAEPDEKSDKPPPDEDKKT